MHDKVPLYSGDAPTSGELLDQIAQAISDALGKIGVTTKVRYELHTRGVNWRVDSILFVSDTLRPKVQAITLTGATLMSASEKLDNTKRLIGEEYSASRVRRIVSPAVCSSSTATRVICELSGPAASQAHRRSTTGVG